MREDELRLAGCRHLPTAWFYPTRHPGAANHGRLAKSICTGCPVREICLLEAVQRNEESGLWGAAGEARRRALRKALVVGLEAYEVAVAAHWRAVDGCPAPGDRFLLSANGSGARHGRRATFAKGCRCEACSQAASLDGARAKIAGRRRSAAS